MSDTKAEKQNDFTLNDGKSSNGKIYVNLEYQHKEIGKKLGCKWDMTEKQWYLPNTTPTTDVQLLLSIFFVDTGKNPLLTVRKYFISDGDNVEVMNKLKYLKKEDAVKLFGREATKPTVVKKEIIAKAQTDYRSMFDDIKKS